MPSRQAVPAEPSTATRRRTYRALVAAAANLMDEGVLPGVPEAAAAADVSRATAYRYFATQTDLLHAVLNTRLAPLSDEMLADIAVTDPLDLLVTRAIPALKENEPQLRAALRLSLEHWQRERDGTLREDETTMVRGGRKAMVDKALEPVDDRLDEGTLRRLAMALSMLVGIEGWVVLKDIWGATDDEAEQTLAWATRALIEAATGA
jgi:AcrR family transcriptional regulator